MELALDKNKPKSSSLVPMSIVGGLFFIFGFVTWLNGALIPFLKVACELDHFQAYLVTMAFYIAYTVMALPVSSVLSKFGYKKGMVYGLLIMAIGALLFVPAAFTREFGLFLFALFVLASGLTLLQTASNPYVVLLGPRETAAVRISIMGLLNKSAGIIAPLIFTALVFADMGQFTEQTLAAMTESDKQTALSELASRLVMPYVAMAVILTVLALMLAFSPLPEPELETNDSDQGQIKQCLKKPQLLFGVIALFVYVGAEVIAGDTIAVFGQSLGVSNYAELTSYTMTFMVLAYITGMVLIPKVISQEQALSYSAIFGIVLTLLILLTPEQSTGLGGLLVEPFGLPAIPNVVLYVAMLGFANALVWPAIWPMALNGLGHLTSTASALLIMAISGGALLPLLYGGLVDGGMADKTAYFILLPCYGLILWYALAGHKPAAVPVAKKEQ